MTESLERRMKKRRRKMTASKYPIGYTKIPVSEIKKADFNYKTEDFDLQQKLKENIKRNGQIENLIVAIDENDNFVCVNGNHRIDVLKELQITEAYCYNLGRLSKTQMERIAIETNETKFPTDMIKLAEVLKDINSDFDIGDMEATMPYTREEINYFLSSLDVDFDSSLGNESTDGETAKEKKQNESEFKDVTCPKCGFEFKL
jgi:hypothetical protein